MSTTATKIDEVLESLAKLEAVEVHYESLLEQEASMVGQQEDIELQLAKELKDVEKLESTSLKSVFYNVLGSKQEQLEKERQEYLELSLRHTEHLKSLELIAYEKEVIGGKLSDIGSLRQELQALKAEREKEILSTPSILRNKLLYNSKQTDEATNHIQRLLETQKLTEATVQSLQIVIGHFRKAKDWGNWDMGSKRSYHYGRLKHNAIDQAVNEANRTNLLLQSMGKALKSVGYQTSNLVIGFDSFSGFMDVLFDNLISDWIVQAKIKKALSSTEAVYNRVMSIKQLVVTDIQKTKDAKVQLLKERGQLLEE